VTVAPNGKKILVVDDVSTTRAILRKLFTEQGYSVIEAESGEDSMDIHMAKVSGLGAIQVIFKIDPGARIIACSSEHSQNYIGEALRMGVKAYIKKPFTAEDVYNALNKAWA
jgi:CheY-like chemotaxis protein